MQAFVRTVAVVVFSAAALAGPGAAAALAEEGDVAWTVRTASNSYGAD
ncbi:MAG: hypothetical protein JWN36_1923, partial [Microbacteriaceae bacterium]|nr:hypothetical protein [Microbacteriaceae bacterium]